MEAERGVDWARFQKCPRGSVVAFPEKPGKEWSKGNFSGEAREENSPAKAANILEILLLPHKKGARRSIRPWIQSKGARSDPLLALGLRGLAGASVVQETRQGVDCG